MSRHFALLKKSPRIISIPALVLFAIIAWMGFSLEKDPGIDVKPDENRFTKTILTEKLNEPMELTFLPGSRVLFVERKGAVKIYDPAAKEVITVATIPVNTKYTNKKGQVREAEEGLMGVITHPDFEKNNWIYMYYADPSDKKHVLARWELKGNKLIEESKKVILEIPTQREECCHTGGGMVFDPQGNLYLTVGNNTVNPQSGTSNLDERPDMENSDDQRTGGNTNDLRGKILRIHPEDDGSYTIPQGNLFPKGMEKTRPEIYTMGHRNPWRPSIDTKTGFLYWGEVGPDASADTDLGPRGYDEFNQAKKAGNFGWPYFQGDNLPYNDYDYATKKIGAAFNPEKPVNDSRNNTGLRELPPAQKAFIWYPYGLSDKFPLVGSSGRSATGGPVYRQANFPNAKRPFPSYYEGKWLIVEFMRGWIMAVTMDENGDFKSMEKFLPNENFGSAIDMDFSPDGDLYILEYGTAWFKGNDNARLVKVEYNAGNRKPVVKVNANKTKGAVPFKLQLSSKETKDYDGDPLNYQWKITGAGVTKSSREPNPVVTLDKAGTYKVSLTVTDKQGASATETIEVLAGNEAPDVKFTILNGNETFYFPNDTLRYSVQVKDREDGSISTGQIKPSQVAVTIDYLPIGYDLIESSQTHRKADTKAFTSTGQILMTQSDCKSCHVMDKKSIGPSYLQIAEKYKDKPEMVDKLASKIINGGVGVWGEHAMSAHPNISKNEAKYIVEYILSLGDKEKFTTLPIKGTYPVKYPEGAKDKGTFVLRAAYRDKGTRVMPAAIGEQVHLLRFPTLDPEKAEIKKGTTLQTAFVKSILMEGDSSFVAFKNIDLTNIEKLVLGASAAPRINSAGGIIEVRLDSANGKLLGATTAYEVKERRENKELVIPPVKGHHDLYFVFRNSKALSNQTLMQFSAVEFKPVAKSATSKP
jgi:cytochrome c